MDKNAIKKYAVWARRELISRVSQKAAFYGITDTDHGTVGAESVDERVLTAAEKKQRDALIHQIQKDGYEQTIEEVAYTWFNRFSALRYMEVNGYLPTHVRVFTDDTGALKPQILTEAINLELDGLDMQKVYDLKNSNQDEALYRYLLITQCNALNAILPGMFQKIEDYTELLLPDNLLREGSVIEQMVTTIPEEDWTDQVQIIGWMYQYYNAEKKDDVFAALKKNVKITKENIPAATQLFTPDWIVRYMVENSLGRIFVDKRKNEGVYADGRGLDEMTWEESEVKRIANEKDIAEQMGWKYYLPEAEQTQEVRKQLDKIQAEYGNLDVTEIKVIDPCMGSGHILVYMFDVLVKIYEAYGYSARDAVKSIVENNLYGLDIDDRAAQLAYFAVMMKARQYDRRFFSRGVQPHVYAIAESNHVDIFAVDYFCNGDAKLTAAMDTIISELHDAKEYGSILTVTPQDWSVLYDRFAEITEDINMSRETALRELVPLVQVAEALAQKYDVVVTNPPYMAVSNAGAKVNDYVKKNFPDSKADLFAVFIERCGQLAKKNGYQAMITQHAWMFLSSFEKLRAKLLSVDIVNMAHLGARAFEEIGGEVVQTTSFVIRKSHIADYKGEYCRLIEPTSQQGKEELFLSGKLRFYKKQDVFSYIPGRIFGYWLSERLIQILIGEKPLSEYGETRKGLSTSDNSRFIRLWHEIDFNRVKFGCSEPEDTFDDKFKWYPYIHGGVFQKWYPPFDSVVNFEDDAKEIKDTVMKKYPYLSSPDFVVKKTEIYFKPGIVWNDLADVFNAKNMAHGYIYSDVTPSYIPQEHWNSVLAYFNSNVFAVIAKVVSQGMHYSTGHIPKIPYIKVTDTIDTYISPIVQECIDLVETDETSFESSWDFTRNPLM